MVWNRLERRDPIAQRLQELEALERERIGQPAGPVDRAIGPAAEKIGERIPEGLRETLSRAFCKGFSLLVSKGSGIIAQTYDGGKLRRRFDELDARISGRRSLRNLRRFGKNAARGKYAVQVASGISGTGMGLLGIGLPDIPIIIATLLRTVYQTAQRCGFGFEGTSERLFVLRLIRNAVEHGELQSRHHQKLLELGEKIDAGTRFVGSLEEETRRTSDALADAVLIAKFVQGLPLVGAVGGITNFFLVGQVSDYAALVYEKRYLLRKSREAAPAPERGLLSQLFGR